MSFSWRCEDKDGKSLFDEFQINSQGLGLAANHNSDTDAPWRLSDIRVMWDRAEFSECCEVAAQCLVQRTKDILLDNLNHLTPHHCPTCMCGQKPTTWDLEQIQRFLSIPVDRVYRCSGGF